MFSTSLVNPFSFFIQTLFFITNQEGGGYDEGFHVIEEDPLLEDNPYKGEDDDEMVDDYDRMDDED